jgi:hypothetical protein
VEVTPEEIKAERQLIFDTVAEHLAKQGGRAAAAVVQCDGLRVVCKYRGPNGTKCAAGCLLKDSEYDPGMEGKDVALIKLPKRLQPHVSLILALQRAHDLRQEGSDCAPIRDRLERIAHRWNLDSRILGTLTFPEVWK